MPDSLVVNLKKESFDIYIGRRTSGMHYGNPFSHKSGTAAAVQVRSREEAVSRYRSWLEGTSDSEIEPLRREWILNNLEILRGKKLGCYCAPRLCHGIVLAELVKP